MRGFRLAGVAGTVVNTAAAAVGAIQQALDCNDCAILIVTEKVAALAPDLVRQVRSRPLVVEIPGLEGPLSGRKNLRQAVQEAVGMRLG